MKQALELYWPISLSFVSRPGFVYANVPIVQLWRLDTHCGKKLVYFSHISLRILKFILCIPCSMYLILWYNYEIMSFPCAEKNVLYLEYLYMVPQSAWQKMATLLLSLSTAVHFRPFIRECEHTNPIHRTITSLTVAFIRKIVFWMMIFIARWSSTTTGNVPTPRFHTIDYQIRFLKISIYLSKQMEIGQISCRKGCQRISTSMSRKWTLRGTSIW